MYVLNTTPWSVPLYVIQKLLRIKNSFHNLSNIFHVTVYTYWAKYSARTTVSLRSVVSLYSFNRTSISTKFWKSTFSSFKLIIVDFWIFSHQSISNLLKVKNIYIQIFQNFWFFFSKMKFLSSEISECVYTHHWITASLN